MIKTSKEGMRLVYNSIMNKREEDKKMKFKEVSSESLKNLGEYLELGYTPRAAWVEDWGDEQDFETLTVEWSDGNQIYSQECNQNLDILVNSIIYEEG